MLQHKVSVTIKRAARNVRLRAALKIYTAQTVPALDVDAYAKKVYQANRAAGL